MKARLLSGNENRKELPENDTKESPAKRRESEKVESTGWWEEFDKPTKAHIKADCNYRME